MDLASCTSSIMEPELHLNHQEEISSHNPDLSDIHIFELDEHYGLIVGIML